MAGQFVKNGATLSCPLCSSSGTLVVSHTQVQLQDTPCATNGDSGKSNLVFGGVCKKWRKSPPPCASVIAPTQWQGVATDVEIDGEFMLLEDSTIGCATGGVDISILHTAQMDVPTDLVEEESLLKKFLVNFRRGSNYKGQYGFDWLRDEYIYPIETIDNIFSLQPYNTTAPVCRDSDDLKDYYKSNDITNQISPYGADYYPAWLSIFADDTYSIIDFFTREDSIHEEGVMISIEIEELEDLVNDDTKLIFEATNDELTIEPSELNLSDLIAKKETKDLGNGFTKEYYLTEDVINISCYRVLQNHEEVKVFAELEGQREEVGKLMIFSNEKVPVMEIVPVQIIIDGNPDPSLPNNYTDLIEKQFLNQALIKTNFTREVEFNLSDLPEGELNTLKSKYFQSGLQLGAFYSEAFFEDIVALYEKYGKNLPITGSIDLPGSKKSYLFYTNIKNSGRGTSSGGFIGSSERKLLALSFGNAAFIGDEGIENITTVKHEIGHSLSLTHVFDKEFFIFNKYQFHQGYTDNIMDYEYKVPQSMINQEPPAIYVNKQFSTFKWQWEIMRTDKSIEY